MWPLGHLAVAYLLYTLSRRTRALGPPVGLAVIVLAFGSQFPDLVDKPLSWYVGVLPTGRTLGHSLLLLVPLSGAVYALARRIDRAELGVAFAVGALSHALVDALPALWRGDSEVNFLLWPLLSVEGYDDGAPSITGLLLESATDPYFLAEFVLAAIAFVLWRAHGYPGLEPIRTLLVRPVADRG